MTGKLEFVCTDRGQHRRVMLGESRSRAPVVFTRRARNAPEREFWDENGNWIGRPDPGQTAFRKDHGRVVRRQYATPRGDAFDIEAGYELLCPKCGRNPQFSGDKLREALKALRDAGFTEVDISLLPL